MRDINIKATEYFEAVARLGSVTKAAEELGVSPSAVSQQVRLLETQFGVQLFRREKRKLMLTEDGDRLFQTTTQAFSAIRNARNAIARQRDLRGLILRTSPSFGVRLLGPRIYSFLSQNPEWSLRVDAAPDFTSFETEAVDFDIRYGLGGWAGLAERCVMSDLVLPMCSPEYLEELKAISPDPIEQLHHARMIDSAKTLFRWDLWLASNSIDIPELHYQLRFDRSSMSIEMAKQGGGLALESVTLCLPDLESGLLVPFCLDFPVVEFPAYWFVCPPRHFNRRIVNRFAEWLTKECREHEDMTRGFLERIGLDFRLETGKGLIRAGQTDDQ
ncbi:LysR family transcriptional regulator [uncultured Cohaesibacter sp.]|uniref:LysR family transcriptional regulator n=1 Tax=uncultured Cohaesibacter sp. TaxID=1002546 RepID=UPI0029C6588A|nr:LysR family transcriptional regulator [uncultured Cohaesibacter sp.]